MINAGMVHLAVARADPGTDCALALDDDHLAPRAGQRAGDREPKNAGADHEAVN